MSEGGRVTWWCVCGTLMVRDHEYVPEVKGWRYRCQRAGCNVRLTVDIEPESEGQAMSCRIDEIRERLAKATPGPWKVQTDSDDDPDARWPWRIVTKNETRVLVDFTGGEIPDDEDAELIAHAPADIAHLLAETEGGVDGR